MKKRRKGDPETGSRITTSPKAQPTKTSRAWQHPMVLAGLLLALVLGAYAPALRGGFIWDDDRYVTDNPMLTDANGLQEIWFSAHTQSQYFPLVYTTFRLEHSLWGLNPVGYHLVNILLHGFNAILLWWVLQRLKAPGAWLAAAIFALHPVNVESVAWVTELKNIESLFFYLLAVLAWIKFLERPGRRRWPYYLLTLAACIVAMFAKTTACTLPAAMALVLWLKEQRFTGARVAQILPFLVIGLGMSLVTVWWEKHLGNYDEPFAGFGLSFSFLQRLLIASRALWFYAGKLAWPADLTFSYPYWQINAAAALQYVPLLGCAVVAVLLWVWRKKIGRGAIAGVVFFVAALSPMLGFISGYTFHYSLVADHYQYNAAIGLIAIFAAALCCWLAGNGFLRPVQAGLLLVLGCLTWQQCGIYKNPETLWRDTLAKNPSSWMAHHNLGAVLFDRDQIDEALEHYQTAVRLYPKGDLEQCDLGTAFLKIGNYSESVQHLETAVAINPRRFSAQNNLGLVYLATGDYDQAKTHFRTAIKLEPHDLGARLNLGRVLTKQGKLDEAVAWYRETAGLFPAEVEPLRRLAWALLKNGKPAEAITRYEQGLQLKPGDADSLGALGETYFTLTNYEAAAGCYRQALQTQPNDPRFHYLLGVTLGQQGRTEAEREELTEALRLQPDFSAAAQQLQSLPVIPKN